MYQSLHSWILNLLIYKNIHILGGFIEGMGYGLVLAVLVGPIFFKILQTSVEEGTLAGGILASGQWLGDFLYVALVFWGAGYVHHLTADEVAKADFIFYMSSIGGILLMLMGLGTMVAKPMAIPTTTNDATKPHISRTHYAALFLQGLAINTINPTPLFFWAMLMGRALQEGYDEANKIGLFVGTLGTVVATDVLKVYLAKHIRQRLQAHHVAYVKRGAGAVLCGFGVFLCLSAVGVFE